MQISKFEEFIHTMRQNEIHAHFDFVYFDKILLDTPQVYKGQIYQQKGGGN